MIEPGDRVTCRHDEFHCLCGNDGCTVHASEPLTVTARRHFPGLGPMLQFQERPHHDDSENPPWFLASAFQPRFDA